MNWKIAVRFAKKNLKANRILEIPFILSTGIMLLLFNIMSSLLSNEYVLTRHQELPQLISFGVLLVGVFVFVFAIYANGFLMKRRNKEFALYGILGLEKKHILRILLIEYLVIFACMLVIAIVGGYFFGKICFLGLNYLMKDTGSRLMDYPFSMLACQYTVIISAILFVLLMIRNQFLIYRATPVQLLGNQHKGEGEPKNRYILLLLGFVSLLGGYYIALTTRGILSSLGYFFVAAMMVMLGTYFLFISFSVFILKKRRNNEKYYYKPTHFLSVSGLLYRMKANAISLASIAILSTGVIITLSVTATIYSTIEESSSNVTPRDYVLSNSEAVDESNMRQVGDSLKTTAQDALPSSASIENDYVSYQMMTVGYLEGNELKPLINVQKSVTPNMVMVMDLDGYNARTGQNVQLKDDEMLLCANQESMLNIGSLKIGDTTYTIHKIPNIIPSNYGVETYGIVVKDFDVMQKIGDTLLEVNTTENEITNPTTVVNYNYDIKGVEETSYISSLNQLIQDTDYYVETRSHTMQVEYQLNGGFLFLGMFIGMIFLVGTILITYYKQISEGYDDRDKFQIMKKVGLPDSLIRKTGNAQVVWLFFAPLVVAGIHSLVASKIISQLLGLFAVHTYLDYAWMLLFVLAIFLVVYFIIYCITSKAYYHIVH